MPKIHIKNNCNIEFIYFSFSLFYKYTERRTHVSVFVSVVFMIKKD